MGISKDDPGKVRQQDEDQKKTKEWEVGKGKGKDAKEIGKK